MAQTWSACAVPTQHQDTTPTSHMQHLLARQILAQQFASQHGQVRSNTVSGSMGSALPRTTSIPMPSQYAYSQSEAPDLESDLLDAMTKVLNGEGVAEEESGIGEFAFQWSTVETAGPSSSSRVLEQILRSAEPLQTPPFPHNSQIQQQPPLASAVGNTMAPPCMTAHSSPQIPANFNDEPLMNGKIASSSSDAQSNRRGITAGAGETPMESCLRNLFQSGRMPHDVRLLTDDGEVNAHRFMLIRRSYFFATRLQGFAKLEPWEPIPRLRIDGISSEVLKHALIYLYTDVCDLRLTSMNSADLARSVELLDAAALLHLPGLEKLLLNQVLGPLALTLPECISRRAHREVARATTIPLSSGGATASCSASPSVNAAGNTAETSQALQPGLVFTGQRGADLLQRVCMDKELREKFQQGLATTLMIKNVPTHVRLERFLQELNQSGFADKYDFVHLPVTANMHQTEPIGAGFAFVNFDDLEAMLIFIGLWHNSCRLGSDIPLDLSFADYQGKDTHVRMWLLSCAGILHTGYTIAGRPEFRPFVKVADRVLGQSSSHKAFVDELVSVMPNVMARTIDNPFEKSSSASLSPAAMKSYGVALEALPAALRSAFQ